MMLKSEKPPDVHCPLEKSLAER